MGPASIQPSQHSSILYAERHDTVDNIVVVLLERLDGLLPTHAGLRHDELNVLGLKTSVVDLLAIVLFLLWLAVAGNSLALVAVGGLVCAALLVGGLCGELLGSGGLGLGVEVLDLGLTEDAANRMSAIRSFAALSCMSFMSKTYIQVLLFGLLYTSGWLMTKRMFFGRLSVTLVIPSTCFRPSLEIALRAFFSFLLWTATEAPAGMLASPASLSESSELSSSTSATFLSGSSGSSSTRGLAMFTVGVCRRWTVAKTEGLAGVLRGGMSGLRAWI